jgi:cytochrome c oxidase subunit 4
MSESTVSETSTDVDASAATAHDAHDESHEIPDRTFITIALILAVLTALEVAATEVSGFPEAILVPWLLILMVLKFYIVIAYFMHLKWDSKIFSLMFYLGLAFAVVLYAVMLTTFEFFTG